MNSLSRREFLRISSLTAASTLAAACAAPTPTAPPAVEPTPAPPEVEPTAPPEVEPTAPPEISRYSEAPMLADLVAAGELPPVDERLPENPYIALTEETGWPGQVVGKYGGTIRRGFKGVADRWGPTKVQETSLTWFSHDLSVHPCLAESWQLNEDATVWTWHLRRGTKWSDGHPFTTEAFRWYWEYQLQNKDLTPSYPANLSWGEPRQLAELETPDDFTAIISFGEPVPLHPYHWVRATPFSPGHYMQRFHIEATDDPDALRKQVEDSGLGSWDQLFVDRNWWYMNPERPSINPWLSRNPLSSELFIMERNPYFYKVDPEGNQLPYFDRVTHRLFETTDVFNMWIVNGEIDFQARHVGIANYTLFKENEQNGDYQVYLGVSASHFAVQPNHTTKEPRLREFFQDRRVRIALSHAVNREEINELVYDGLATPRQYSPLPVSPNYYPKLSNAYLEYDPDKANQLLDEAGYAERDREGFRLHKDGSGETLSFIIEGTTPPGDPGEDAIQMVVKYYADVGLKTSYKYVDRSLYEEHWGANEIEMASWGGDRTLMPIITPWIFTGTMIDRPWACAWGHWYNNPENPVAERPPDGHWIWDIWHIWESINLEPDEQARNKLFEGILDIWAEELPMIAYLGEFPAPIIVKNGINNYFPGMPMDTLPKDEHLLQTETYFWEDPKAHR